VGKNADILPDILRLYVPEGSVIADVTFGMGWFWKKVDTRKYTLLASDNSERIFNPQVEMWSTIYRFQADFTELPFRDESLDAIIFDPPYGQGSTTTPLQTVGASYNLKPCKGPETVGEFYSNMQEEAIRIIKTNGVVIIKCQDMVNQHKQFWFHCDIWEEWSNRLWEFVDLFVLVQEHTPIMRHAYQLHARKNHSYFWVARKRR